MVEGWHCRRLASLIFLPKYREKYTYLSGNWTDVELKKRWNFVFCLSWACCLDVVLAPATAAAAEQAARVSMFLSWLLAADWKPKKLIILEIARFSAILPIQLWIKDFLLYWALIHYHKYDTSFSETWHFHFVLSWLSSVLQLKCRTINTSKHSHLHLEETN